MPCRLQDSIADLAFVDEKSKAALAKAHFETVGDLVTWFPRRHEDRRTFDGFPTSPMPEPVCLHAEVTDAGKRFFGRKSYFFAKVEAAEETVFAAPITLRWFNMPFMHKIIAVGHELVLYGKVKDGKGGLVIDHPDFEIVEPDNASATIHLERIVPVYRLRDGLQQRTIRQTLFHLLRQLEEDSVRDILRKPSTKGGFAGLNRFRALQSFHFPETTEEQEQARRYLALEEFFVLQLNVLARKQRYVQKKGIGHQGDGRLWAKLLEQLPFAPTSAQERSIDEIRKDMTDPKPMNRLLQGDVGSGKTLVALAAMLHAVEGGHQAALMAPTQILAEQHFLVFQRYLEPLGVKIALRTANRKEETDDMPLFTGNADSQDAAQIVIGTHALLHDAFEFDSLGLVVIDEQHKFGVTQRAKLIGQGVAPDVLVMTATPIPRTLTMTVYGDLDVSELDEMPSGRGKIITAVRAGAKVSQVTSFLKEHLKAGRQTYIVYPLIDDSEKLKAKSAAGEFDAWAKRLKGYRCALLHGRIAPEEKDSLMSQFRAGEIDVLVSTTVIEVGVDVPNANIMLIYSAERFGLAQLHQLRGRVGRGEHDSFCILVCDEKNTEALDRLKILETTRDGFQIADADLKIRGPGDLLGTAQSGLPGLALGDLVTDTRLVKTARELAADTLEKDPKLKSERYAHLKGLIVEGEILTAQG